MVVVQRRQRLERGDARRVAVRRIGDDLGELRTVAREFEVLDEAHRRLAHLAVPVLEPPADGARRRRPRPARSRARPPDAGGGRAPAARRVAQRRSASARTPAPGSRADRAQSLRPSMPPS
jgi:hypothetical protein